MSLLAALIVGGIVGWLASLITGRSEGIFGSIAIGVVGAVIGGYLASLFNSGNQTYLSFTWAGFIWSVVGAVIFASILNVLQHRTHHSS